MEHKLKIIEIIDETPDTKTFRLGIPDGINLNFFPGQFFMVRFDDNLKLQRAYSVASSPEQKKYIDITLNLVAEFTKKLWDTKVDDFLIFKGPFGKFFFNDEIKNDIILIGGGLGVTPLMSLIRYCNNKKLPNKVNLIYSVKTPADIVYKDELKQIEGEYQKFRYTITVTRPQPEHNWKGRTGRIDLDLLKQNIDKVENYLYYLCGPLEFVKSTIAMLESLGATKEQIKTDVWG